MRNFSVPATFAAFIAVAPGSVFAQSQEDELETLRERVAALEAETRTRPRLQFNVGENTNITLYGFIRAEAFYDSDFQQGDLTRTSRIGEPVFATDGAFDTSVRVSRFGIRSSTETDIGTIGTQLEFDLFGSGGDDSGSPNLRLRHANVTIGDHWLVGQFWTNFMPLQHYPTTADFNGPVGITFARVPQIRYTSSEINGFQYSFSIEESNGTSTDPLLTAAAVYNSDIWSARIAGLVGEADSAGSSFSTEGITISGSVQPWSGASFGATYVTGSGIGSLLIGGGAEVVGGATNDVDGYTLEFRQQIGEKWNVGIVYGNESYDSPTTPSGGTIDFTDLESLFLNVFYEPTDRLRLGFEYSRGERTTSTGTTFTADRIGTSITFSF